MKRWLLALTCADPFGKWGWIHRVAVGLTPVDAFLVVRDLARQEAARLEAARKGAAVGDAASYARAESNAVLVAAFEVTGEEHERLVEEGDVS